MRYASRTVIGLAILFAAATVTSYGIYQFLQIGTCASGGPYVSARPCPAGTGRLLLLVAGGFVASFAGLFVFGSRGDPPGGARVRVNAPVLMWCLLFLGISFACFWGVWGPDADPGPGGKLGGLIVAFLFAAMGLPALAFVFSRREAT